MDRYLHLHPVPGSLAVYLGSGMFDKYQDSIRRLYMNRMGVLQETVRENPAPGLEWNIPGFRFLCMCEVKKGYAF